MKYHTLTLQYLNSEHVQPQKVLCSFQMLFYVNTEQAPPNCSLQSAVFRHQFPDAVRISSPLVHVFLPVSYTHLDVYKRQGIARRAAK